MDLLRLFKLSCKSLSGIKLTHNYVREIKALIKYITRVICMDFTYKPDEIPINCKSMGPFKRNRGFSPDNVTSDTTAAYSYESHSKISLVTKEYSLWHHHRSLCKLLISQQTNIKNKKVNDVLASSTTRQILSVINKKRKKRTWLYHMRGGGLIMMIKFYDNW